MEIRRWDEVDRLLLLLLLLLSNCMLCCTGVEDQLIDQFHGPMVFLVICHDPTLDDGQAMTHCVEWHKGLCCLLS